MKGTNYSRRQFIKTLSIGTCSLLMFPKCTFSKDTTWRFFTKHEADLVDAIVEQIIPTDDWPGAKDAMVTNFIDKQLVGSYTRHQETYRKGLSAIQIACKRFFNKNFEELQWDEQTNFLQRLERNDILTHITPESAANINPISEVDMHAMEKWLNSGFFHLIREHTMQGFYGSPRHGGNHKFISYRMIGLDPFPIMGQNRYNDINNG